MAASPEIIDYIRRAAIARGIDPDVALEVARREALNVFDPNQPDLGGDDRSSFGVYQLHYGGRSAAMPNAGLGDEFTRRTGLRADDPSTWRQQVDFSLDYAKDHGWGSWMGAKAAGITGMMGINGNPSTAVASTGATPAVSSTLADATVPPPLWPTPQFDPDNPVSSTLSGLLSSRVASGPLLPPARRSAVIPDVINGGAEALPDAPPEFASANPEPDQLPPAVSTPSPLAAVDQSDGGLADLFKIKDIGQAAMLDPRTQQPVMARQRRSYG